MLCPLCWRKDRRVSHVMSFVLKESRLSLSFSCHVLCAEGKPSDSEFLMSCTLCWKKAIWVWVSHVMSFVLKESPLTESEFLISYPLCWRKALWLSASFSCHVLCAEGKPSDSEFLMSCPLCWRKTLGLGVWVLKLNEKLGKNSTEELAKTIISQKKHWRNKTVELH